MKKPTLITFLFLALCALNLKTKAADVSDLTYNDVRGYITITDCNLDASGELIIPETIEGLPVKKINSKVFQNCTLLTSISIPKGITYITSSSFAGCINLTSFTIGEGVRTIDGTPFYGCISLTNINVDKNNSNFTDVDGILFNKQET